VTATQATPSLGRITSTVNTPPSPDLVCVIAFVQSSDTHVINVSLAGQPASCADTKARARSTDTAVPWNTRAVRSLPSDHRSTGYAAVIAITPCTYTRYGADIIYLLLVTRSQSIWFSVRWNCSQLPPSLLHRFHAHSSQSPHRRTGGGNKLNPPASVLPFIAAQPLTDHHCHGVLRGEVSAPDLTSLLDEGSAGSFDSLAGFSFLRWCPPVLDLDPHVPLAAYLARRAELGAPEVTRRFLGRAWLGALFVDTGFHAAQLVTPSEMGGFAGGGAAGGRCRVAGRGDRGRLRGRLSRRAGRAH
jgi:hypothetical protein